MHVFIEKHRAEFCIKAAYLVIRDARGNQDAWCLRHHQSDPR